MGEINIGFIGLGNMGHHICLALIQNSYKVTVHDINIEAAIPSLEMGASWADNPKELAPPSAVGTSRGFQSLPA